AQLPGARASPGSAGGFGSGSRTTARRGDALLKKAALLMRVSLHFRAAALGAALLSAGALGPLRPDREPEWVGARRLRLLVEVRPEPLDGRAGDERPARVALDLERLLAQAGITERADLSTLQVMRYDAATGKPIRYDNNLFAE